MNRIQIKEHLLFPLVGGVAILVSLLVMLGWVLGIHVLTSLSAAYPTMKFNTALAFALTGAATLLMYSIDNKRARYFYRAFSVIIFLIGFFTLLEFIFGISLGIDNLFIADPWPLSVINPHPGRMAGGTALSFCLLGISFFGLVSSVNRFRHWAQYALHLVSIIGYIAFLGYVFNVSASQIFSPFISIALHTSIMFILLSFVLSFYNAEMGLTGLFTGKGVGDIMVRRLFPVLMVLTVVLGYLRIRFFSFHILSVQFGVAISATVLLTVMLVLLWRTALQLNNLEERRLQTEEANFKLKLDMATAETARREMDEVNRRNLLFVRQAPSAIAMLDRDMRYLAVSEQWLKDYNLTGKDIIGRSHYDVFPEIGDDWKKNHRYCLQGNIHKSDGTLFVRADGTEQWITWDVRPWYDNNNNVGGLLMYTGDISNLKRKELIIQETTERLAEAQHVAHVGSWDWNIVTGETKWSDELYRISGLDPMTVKPQKGFFATMAGADGAEKLRLVTEEAMAGKPISDIQLSITRPDGTQREIETRAKVFFNHEGKPVRVLSTVADITERKKSEALIKETTESLAEAQQIAHVGSWDWDIAAGKMNWSDEQYRIYGFEPGTVDPNSGLFYNMLHPDDKYRVIAALGDALNGTKPYATECRLVWADGSVRDIDARGKVIRNKDGQPVRFIGTLADITPRKKLERELMLSEKEFRSSFENSAIGMALTSIHGRFLKVNPELATMLGYTEAELQLLTFMDVTDPASVTDNVNHMHQLVTGAIDKYGTEKKYIHKNGGTVWAHLTVSTVFDEQQQPLYMVSQMTDITGRKQMERDLQKVNTELKSIFNAETHVSIIGTDLNGIITHFSRGAEILLGYRAHEMIGFHTPEIIHDTQEMETRGNELSALLKRYVKGFDVFVAVAKDQQFESREWTYVRKDGTRLPVQLVVSTTKDENGNIKGYLGIATDISERKNAEEARKNNAVLQSRNKEMEEFAYIASHDLQEPLRTVTSFIRLMNEEYGAQIPPDAQQYLQFISASGRMRELIKGLLEFSRLGKQKTAEPVDCNILVKEVIEDLGEAIKESKAIVTVGQLPVINALPTEMKQLFQNLISNAIKFRKPDGTPQIHVSVKPEPGFWQFEICDNGIGIDAQHYHKIFILFQRLHKRDDYPGTGIGLSYCKKNVELHHGRIWVESVANEGSRFFFTISNRLA